MLHKITASATAGIEKTRIRSSELKLGMFVTKLDRPWLESPFLIHGFVVRDQQQLQQIQDLCAHVYIDITRDSSSKRAHSGAKPSNTTAYKTTASFSENLAAAQQIHGQAKAIVKDMFDDFRTGKLFEIGALCARW